MQYVVNVGFGQSRKRVFAWFEGHGYVIASYLKADEWFTGVPCVLIENGGVFGINITCLAAMVSCGGKVLEWEEWLDCVGAL